MKKSFTLLALLAILFLPFHFSYAQGQASDTEMGIIDQFDEVRKGAGQTIESAPKDIRIVIGEIIRYVLGFLGIILVVITLYAGFLWMTAGGDSDKIAQAKKWIMNAIIGLIIVLSSYAITTYVVNSVQKSLNDSACAGGNLQQCLQNL